MSEAAREELRRDLARRIEAEQADLILLALHIGCGAFALGMERVEPLPLKKVTETLAR